MAVKNPFAEALKLNEAGNVTLQLLAEAGYLWSYRGQFDKAASIFNALTLLAPNDPLPYLGLAEVYLSQCKYREADKTADRAARLNTIDRRTMAFAYKLRGKSLLQMNKPGEAEKLWQRAIELDKEGPEGQASAELLRIAREIGVLGDGKAQAGGKAAAGKS